MTPVKLSAIVAVGQDGEIGRGGGLPWPKLRHDMQWFRKQTLGKPVIMGRRTWESLPARPLPGRTNLVLTRRGLPLRDGAEAEVFANAPSVLRFLAAMWPDTEAVVIGGRRTYDALWDYIGTIYLTKVDVAVSDADTFFPYPLSPCEWDERAAHDRFFVDPASGIRTGYFVFTRKAAHP